MVFLALTAWDAQSVKTQCADRLGPETDRETVVTGALSLHPNFVSVFPLPLPLRRTGQREE